MTDFFDKLYSGIDKGYIEIRSFNKDASSLSRSFIPFSSRNSVEEIAHEYQGYDCYFGVCTRLTDTVGTKDNLSQAMACWVDVDHEYDPDLITLIPPTDIVTTSTGKYHLYWLLKDPLDVTKEENIKLLESANFNLAKIFEGDKCYNADRILRVPGSINLKTNELVEWKEYPVGLYDINDLLNVYMPVEEGERNTTLASLVGRWYKNKLPYEDIVKKAINWNSLNNPPMLEREVIRTIRSVLNTIDREEDNEKKKWWFSYYAARQDNGTKELRTSSGLILKGITTVIGLAGVGKSVFALNMVKLALEKQWDVLYIDYENGITRIRERVNKIGIERDFKYFLEYNKDVIMSTLDLVIIDSIQRTGVHDPLREIEVVLSEIEKIKIRHDIIFLLISEQNSEGGGRWTARLDFCSDIVYNIIRESEDEIRIFCKKDRDGEIQLKSWDFWLRDCKFIKKEN